MSKTTFPTPLEGIRLLHHLCGFSQGDKKKLDDRIKNIDLLKTRTQESIETFFLSPMRKIVPDKLTTEMEREINNTIDTYLNDIVREIRVDGLTREIVNSILIPNFIYPRIYYFIKNLPNEYQLLNVDSLFDKETYSVPKVINILMNDLTWQAYIKNGRPRKEFIDNLRRWQNQEMLPSFQSILLFGQDSKLDKLFLSKIKLWLTIGRALDSIRNSLSKELFFTNNVDRNIDKLLSFRQYSESHTYKEVLHNYPILLEHLNRIGKKQSNSRKIAKEFLDKSYDILKNINKLENVRYTFDMLNARWHLLSGNLEQAINLYESSFENALFKSGPDLKKIIEECLIATSFYEQRYGKSKRKFLAHLKYAMILFNFELPSIPKKIYKINHKDIIEDWEVDIWAREFKYFFPKDGWFNHTNYEVFNRRTEDLTLLVSDLEKIEPDYSKPNKEISYGNGTKKMPQLSFFTMLNRADIVKKLLDNGADVNKLSNCNESAISLALGHLILDHMGRSQNIELFEIISRYPHSKDVINSKFDKTKETAIMLAVKSGRSKIVKKVLEMGADANEFNHIEICNPLILALQQIDFFKNPDKKYNKLYLNGYINNTLELQEYMKRHGSPPFGESDIPEDEISMAIKACLPKAMMSLEIKNFNTYSSLEELHKIIDILLCYGADPNLAYDVNKLKKYTPLMLAVELNDNISFDMMIKKGGNPLQECIGLDKNKYNCRHIKKRWNSNKIRF